MNNENKYQYINNLSKEYKRVLWNIMIKAECNHFVAEPERLSKQECKLIMKFLYKIFNNINKLQQENKQLEQDLYIALNKIDKAIEYIKSDEYWYSQVNSEEKLLEILGDKENER